jgi:hypothetical protein
VRAQSRWNSCIWANNPHLQELRSTAPQPAHQALRLLLRCTHAEPVATRATALQLGPSSWGCNHWHSEVQAARTADAACPAHAGSCCQRRHGGALGSPDMCWRAGQQLLFVQEIDRWKAWVRHRAAAKCKNAGKEHLYPCMQTKTPSRTW